MDLSAKSMKREHWAGSIFGIISMFLSFVISLAAGNDFGFSIGRAFLMGLFFAAFGFGVVLVLKKYIPELYNVGLQQESSAPVETSDSVEIAEGAAESFVSSAPAKAGQEPIEVQSSDESPAVDIQPPKFEPLSDHVDNIEPGHLNVKGGKMGKHVLQEQAMKYEPKIVAEAIRTMMSKDH